MHIFFVHLSFLCLSPQYDNVPVLGLTQYDQNMRPVGYLYVIFTLIQNGTQVNLHKSKQLNIISVCHLHRNGEILYGLPSNSYVPPDFAASPSNMFLPRQVWPGQIGLKVMWWTNWFEVQLCVANNMVLTNEDS